MTKKELLDIGGGVYRLGKDPADQKGLKAFEKRAGEGERGITAKKLIKLLRGY